jgi:glycosyltransferase involved in cell wall biosynthesis
LSIKIKATIIFATYNGERTLPVMLDALCQSTTPLGEWKIVAVNNNSTDNTNDILHSYLTRLPMEIYFEKTPGKAAAIDRGFRYLEGELVIITDDDVRPAQDWIEQFLKLAEGCPDYDMFGGLILPEWEQLPEPWVLEWVDHVSVYALNETVKEGPISAGYIFGPNSAFRRRVLPDKYSAHDSSIGPNSDVQQYPMGCDTLFARSIEARGHKAWHSRLPVVQHFVPAKYLDERWIFQRAERHGLGMPVAQPDLFRNRKIVFGHPVGMLITFSAMAIMVKIVEWLPRSKLRHRFLRGYNRRKGMLKMTRIMTNTK